MQRAPTIICLGSPNRVSPEIPVSTPDPFQPPVDPVSTPDPFQPPEDPVSTPDLFQPPETVIDDDYFSIERGPTLRDLILELSCTVDSLIEPQQSCRCRNPATVPAYRPSPVPFNSVKHTMALPVFNSVKHTVPHSPPNPLTIATHQFSISPKRLLELRVKSCSIGNFAKNLVVERFSPPELVNRNCNGVKGKQALEPEHMAAIKQYCFRYFTFPSAEHSQIWAGKCAIAIDEYLRRRARSSLAQERAEYCSMCVGFI